MRQLGWVVRHLMSDQTSVNSMKQTCVIIILGYILPDSSLNHTKMQLKHKKYPSYTGYLDSKWHQLVNFECHGHMFTFSKQAFLK